MQALPVRFLGRLLGELIDGFVLYLQLVVTFGIGGAGLAMLILSFIAVPGAVVERDPSLLLFGVCSFAITLNFYYYFRVAAFILLRFGRRGLREASFRSVLCQDSSYEEFYVLHRRLRRLTAEYPHLLSDDEVSRGSTLARRHRIAAWISGSTFVAAILVVAVLGAVGVIEPSG